MPPADAGMNELTTAPNAFAVENAAIPTKININRSKRNVTKIMKRAIKSSVESPILCKVYRAISFLSKNMASVNSVRSI